MKKLSILTFGIVAAWFLFLIYGMGVLFDYGIGKKSENAQQSETKNQQDDRLIILKLKNRLKNLELKLREMEKSPKSSKKIIKNCNFSKFSFDAETARRRVHSGVKEFWFDVRGRFEELRKNLGADGKFKAILDKSESKLAEHYRS
uniref:Alpha-(1,6)-fucosyltransferase N- and catalytic domain-containing protein n=1 Tax=Romanomermis culicivorax TaxID=13658 RepID=A0A915LA12_ROMCU